MASTVWKGQITFGLVSIPVRLYRAARRERVKLHYLAQSESREPEFAEEEPAEAEEHAEPDFHAPPVGQVARVSQTVVSQDDRRQISSADLLRGHEVAPGRYVTFTQPEMRAMRLKTSTTMEVVRSVRLDEIDPVYFETSYYVTPDRGGERAYALLFAALKESAHVALAKVTMHGREHVVLIRPGAKGLLAHTMFYSNEIRQETEYEAQAGEVAPKELQLARTFVDAIAGPFAPEEFQDAYREKLNTAIAEREARQQVASAAAGSQADTAPPVVDIMEALRRSIESRKAASQVARREPGSATEIKDKARKKRRA